jgi:hypothetical protein
MSKLAFIGRPWVAFDASNKDHRKWFAEFQRLSTWGKCPVRFIIDDEDGDLITLCQRRLIAYYVEQEFNVRAKSNRPTVKSKITAVAA